MLVTIPEVRAVVVTELDDTQLTAIIEREESEMISRLGPNDASITMELHGCSEQLFLPRPLLSVESVGERDSYNAPAVLVAATSYALIYNGGALLRTDGTWQRVVTVIGEPADLDRRKQILIELVRLAIEQTAMRSESIAGEYSFTAPEWERARADLLRRATYTSI